MKNPDQPAITDKLITIATVKGLTKVGVSYYRMDPGDNLPYHRDTYKRYIEVNDLKGLESQIYRVIIFPERWKEGHYLEVDGTPYVSWSAGTSVTWAYQTPHLAANLGFEPRYTIQLTGLTGVFHKSNYHK